jgi:hypothetical protein
LSYNVESQIGGKLAQLGQRLINSAAKKTADDFFEKFSRNRPTGHTATSTSQWLKHHGGASLQERPMRTYRFGRKIKLPATFAIKDQIRMLMAQDEAKTAEAEARTEAFRGQPPKELLVK